MGCHNDRILSDIAIAVYSERKGDNNMDTSKILRPEQLPFPVPPELEYAINELLAAWERDESLNLDCYLDEVQAAARGVNEEKDAWLRKYYVQYGWRKGMNYDD